MVENTGRTPLHFGDSWWGTVADPLRQIAAKVADFFAPPVEASHTQDNYEICIELPGVAEEDIAINVSYNMLTVSGEKRFSRRQGGRDFFFSEFSYGKFQRSFRLPEDVDVDHVKATHTDGVLSISIPKKEPSKVGKRIAISKT